MNQQAAISEAISSPQADYDSLRHVGPEIACPYLPGLQSRSEAYWVDVLDPAHYEALMGRGFRRSGRVVYRPRCRECFACQPIRVPVATFEFRRSFRRVWSRNQDLVVTVEVPAPTAEKYVLFRHYLTERHDGSMARDYSTFERFLYDSPTDTLEFTYRLGPRLVGVAIADRCPNGLSSVYMYSDPALAERSLGTYSILWEIAWCRQNGLAFYYLGYYVSGSSTMQYKARFRPNETLTSDGRWSAACA